MRWDNRGAWAPRPPTRPPRQERVKRPRIVPVIRRPAGFCHIQGPEVLAVVLGGAIPGPFEQPPDPRESVRVNPPVCIPARGCDPVMRPERGPRPVGPAGIRPPVRRVALPGFPQAAPHPAPGEVRCHLCRRPAPALDRSDDRGGAGASATRGRRRVLLLCGALPRLPADRGCGGFHNPTKPSGLVRRQCAPNPLRHLPGRRRGAFPVPGKRRAGQALLGVHHQPHRQNPLRQGKRRRRPARLGEPGETGRARRAVPPPDPVPISLSGHTVTGTVGAKRRRAPALGFHARHAGRLRRKAGAKGAEVQGYLLGLRGLSDQKKKMASSPYLCIALGKATIRPIMWTGVRPNVSGFPISNRGPKRFPSGYPSICWSGSRSLPTSGMSRTSHSSKSGWPRRSTHKSDSPYTIRLWKAT